MGQYNEIKSQCKQKAFPSPPPLKTIFKLVHLMALESIPQTQCTVTPRLITKQLLFPQKLISAYGIHPLNSFKVSFINNEC